MAAASCVLTEDQFLCSICLDVFTDPVSITCGHNFCKECIMKHWDITFPFQCPVCKDTFDTRPELRINMFISEMAAQFKQSAQQKTSSSSEQQFNKPGEVFCDVCNGTKLKALKSCLVCLTSYCKTHLEPHLTKSGLKSHQLIDPVENLEGIMCQKHNKPLELFCKDDLMCICMLCTVSDHKKHDAVTLKEAREGKKVELEKIESEIQEMIQKKQQKIDEFKHSVKLSNEDADRVKRGGVQYFTALKEIIERYINETVEKIEAKQRTSKEQAEGFITELKQEIFELKERSAEMKQLSNTKDDLGFLQKFDCLNVASHTKDWTKITIPTPMYEEAVKKSLERLIEHLEGSQTELDVVWLSLSEGELKRIQQIAVDVTLDPDTAHPNLTLSDDGKQVKHGIIRKKVPDNPERFSQSYSVLGKDGFSSGRFYFEVQVEEKVGWRVGVVKESITKKGGDLQSPQKGYWMIGLRNKKYTAHTDPPEDISHCVETEFEKLGVFVDYEEGLVSFYNVDARGHIYSFTGCSFTEKLYPFFNPSNNGGVKNSAPLVITPVSQSRNK